MPTNPRWTHEMAVSSFEDEGDHAEILKILEAFDRRDLYLNVGYSGKGQRHWAVKAQQRLIDRLARGILRYSKLERKILDIGSGRGGPAFRLHERWKMDVTGIDPSDRNLELARRRTRDLEIHAGVVFKKGRVDHLPFSDAEFAHAITTEALAYVADKKNALSEIRRVMKEGGCLAMAVLTRNDPVVSSSLQNTTAYREFLEAWDFHSLPPLDQYEVMLADAGFEIKRSEDATQRTLDRHTPRLSRLLRFADSGILFRIAGSWIRRRTDANLDALRPQLEASLAALEAGLLGYGLIWAVAVPRTAWPGDRGSQ